MSGLQTKLAIVAFSLLLIPAHSLSQSGSEHNLAQTLSRVHETLERLEIEYSNTSIELGQQLYDAYADSGIMRHEVSEIEDPGLLDSLFDATRTVSFYHPQSGDVANRLVDVLFQLDDLDGATKAHFRKAYWGAFKARQFDRANQVARVDSSYPTVELKDFVSDEGRRHRTVLKASEDGRRFERRSHGITDGTSFIVLFDPLCGPSRKLLKAITVDPRASETFSSYGLLLVPQYVRLDSGQLAVLQQSLPFEVSLMYSYSEWDDVESTFTPTMYVFDDGELTRRIVGDQQAMLKAMQSD